MNTRSYVLASFLYAILGAAVVTADGDVYVNPASGCPFPTGGPECVMVGGVATFGPYPSFEATLQLVPDGTTLVLYSGGYMKLGNRLTKPVTLKSFAGPVHLVHSPL